jgi:integrase
MATIRKRNDKWQVQIRRIGFSAISKSFHVRKDAIAWARQTEVQGDRADLPPDPKALQRVTLGELVERYRNTISPRKRTGLAEQLMLRAFLRRPICSKRLSELRTEDFAGYRDERLKVIKLASLRRELGPIRNLFKVARDEWGFPIRENPLDKLRLNGIDQRRERRLKPGELLRIVESARQCRNRLVLPIIQIALETGMRRSEILATRKQHIDFERRTLLIPFTKNGDSRTIPLTNQAIVILRDELREDRFFSLTPNAFRLAWERVTRRAEISDLHFHDLRHEAISRLFEKGLSVPEVALISGHRDMRMLFRYAHASRQTILAKLDAA